jgi:hypothetical protein
MRSPAIKSRVEAFVLASEGLVFQVRALGGRSQVGSALRQPIRNGVLVKVGHRIYARARASSLSGNPVPAADLLPIGFETLRKLGVGAEVGRDMRALMEGRSTQVPMALIISVDRPVGRGIGFGRKNIAFERR